VGKRCWLLIQSPGALSTHMLYSAAQYLNDQARSLAAVRDSFNDVCYSAENTFGPSQAASAFGEFFTAWCSAFDGQAETMGSVGDATGQCAVIYDHAERTVLGALPAMPTAPPSVPQPPSDIAVLLNPRQPEA
jgi:hypothetical protein